MILTREFKPNESEIIYHYCDANAFLSICSNKKLWFNDLFSMNDFLELHWGYSIWEEAASARIKKYGFEFIEEIDKIIHFLGFQGLLLANSFSIDNDVLSQWRAYANDGRGYVIGFNAVNLLGLPIRALKVLYDQDQQIKEAITCIDVLFEMKQDNSLDFNTLCGVFGYDLSAFKNPAFSEEKEIRLIHVLSLEPINEYFKLVDEGGVSFGQDRVGEKVQYRIKQNIPTPYIELDFTNNGKVNPIKRF